MKRLALIAVLLFFVAGVVTIGWTAAGLPPARYVLRYGFHPRCEPTGETMEIEGVRFIEIGPGIFRMGSDHDARGGDWRGKLCRRVGLPWGDQPEPSDEMPVHWVEFRRGFWIAKTEVTNEQYERFAPWHERSNVGKSDNHPVVNVSWEDAKQYCAWLWERAGQPVRLPTEAEWECACRAGSNSEFCFGDDEAELERYAWFDGNSEVHAHEVATRLPNRWGLYDMHGNVLEWCEDVVHGSYEGAPRDGSAWAPGRLPDRYSPGGLPGRYSRGGDWLRRAGFCRSACRCGWVPTFRIEYIGFRPALVPLED